MSISLHKITVAETFAFEQNAEYYKLVTQFRELLLESREAILRLNIDEPTIDLSENEGKKEIGFSLGGSCETAEKKEELQKVYMGIFAQMKNK